MAIFQPRPVLYLAAVAVAFGLPQNTLTSLAPRCKWTDVPSNGIYSTAGFGGITEPTGSGITYQGNVGSPYGSNFFRVSAADACAYEYVVQFQGPNANDWTVVFWNKYGPYGKMDGWYGHGCLEFGLGAGDTEYVAIAPDSQGAWAAAPGPIPTDQAGSYAATWGEFDVGSKVNEGWSGFDVSVIQAQNAGLAVQGMKICDALGSACSSVTPNAKIVNNAYTATLASVGGLGGNLRPGPVRLNVTIDYQG